MIPLSLLFVLGSLGLLVWGLVVTSQVLVWGSLGASIAAGVCLLVSVLLRRRFPAADGSPSADLPPLPIDIPGPGVVPPALPPFGSPSAGHPGAVPTSTGRPPTDSGAENASPSSWVESPDAQAGSPPTQPPTGATGRPDDVSGTPVAPPEAGARSPADGVTPGDQMPLQPQSQDSAVATPATPATEPTSEGEPPQEDIPVAAALRAAQLDDEVRVVDGRPRYHLPGCDFLRGKPTVPLPLSTARRTGFTPCGLCCPDATLLARARAPRGEG